MGDGFEGLIEYVCLMSIDDAEIQLSYTSLSINRYLPCLGGRRIATSFSRRIFSRSSVLEMRGRLVAWRDLSAHVSGQSDKRTQ